MTSRGRIQANAFNAAIRKTFWALTLAKRHGLRHKSPVNRIFNPSACFRSWIPWGIGWGLWGWACLLAPFLLTRSWAGAAEADAIPRPFVVEVVDDSTGRGVPLVELRSVHKVSWWTDNAGVAALMEPGWDGRDVFLHVSSPGYEYPQDGMGFRGVQARYTSGGGVQIRLKRIQVAERCCRLTGEGLYRDSLLAGRAVPLPRAQGILNAEVLGQDSVVATPFGGKIWWFWGDTDRLAYPLGHFGSSAATSEMPGRGSFPIEKGISFRYLVQKNGFAKPVCVLDGKGLRWIESVFVLPNDSGSGENLYARVAHQKDLGEVWAWHLMRWNADREEFESVEKWDWKEFHDVAHPFRATVDGVPWLFLYPNQRVLPRLDSVRRLEDYESFTCLAGDGVENLVERDGEGRVVYRWKKGAVRLNSDRVRELVKSGRMKVSEAWMPWVDMETGKEVECGRHSVAWNGWLKRWVMIAAGKPGEIWFSTADTPTGPWGYARKVAVHGAYNFYNPVHHAFLDEEGGRRIYFEGTYTAAFSGARTQTPRYDYNQILYRLDLDDERLQLPVPVYRVWVEESGGRRMEYRLGVGGGVVRGEEIAFWVRSRPRAGDVVVVARSGGVLLGRAQFREGTGDVLLGWIPRKAGVGVGAEMDQRWLQPLYGEVGDAKNEQETRLFLEAGEKREPVGYVYRNPVEARTWTRGVHP